jgi:hypothetical protein
MNRVAFAGVQQSTGMPLPLFMVATFLQSFLLTAVLGFLGVLLSGKTGLGLLCSSRSSIEMQMTRTVR